MKKFVIQGVEWSSDEVKNFICSDFTLYYGARILKSAVKIEFEYLTRFNTTAIKFYVKTPCLMEYDGYRRIHYTCEFETGIFTRDEV